MTESGSMTKFETKLQALSWFLNKNWHHIIYYNDIQVYSIANMEYMVLTKEEAKEVFNSSLIYHLHEINYNAIVDHMKYMPKIGATNVVTYFQSLGADFNVALYKLLGDAYVALVDYLFDNDSLTRGQVLAKHDGIEFDLGQFFVYRLR